MGRTDDEERRLALPKADSDGRQPELPIGEIIRDRVLAKLGARRGGGPVSDEGKGSPPADEMIPTDGPTA